MKRILMCYHSSTPGGVEKQILDIVQGLSKRAKFYIACPSGVLVKDYIEQGAVNHFNIAPKFEADFFYVFKIYKIIKENGINVVHAHELKTGSLAIFAAWLAGVEKRIYHVHTPFGQWQYGTWKRYPALIINTIVNAIVGNVFATDVLALTDTIKDIRIKKEFIKPSKITVIPNGVNTDVLFYSEKERARIRKKFGITPETFLIGNIGRVTEEKGISYLVLAFSYLIKNMEKEYVVNNRTGVKSNELKLLIGGGGRLLPDIKEYAEKLGIASHIIFTDRYDEEDKIGLFSSLDLFVFPTLAEGFGIALIEAMSFGLPIICSDLPVLRDVAGDYVSYFKCADAEDLCERIVNHLEEDFSYISMAERSIDCAEKFTIKLFWTRYAKLYGIDSTSA